ncbi:MAG: hypothetical protein AAGD14_04535 [Planctomycetota bacterium]
MGGRDGDRGGWRTHAVSYLLPVALIFWFTADWVGVDYGLRAVALSHLGPFVIFVIFPGAAFPTAGDVAWIVGGCVLAAAIFLPLYARSALTKLSGAVALAIWLVLGGFLYLVKLGMSV